MPVLIAGGGIGGLSLAIALHARGIEARVFEQADRLRAAGAGITVQTNAMIVLRQLGLDEALLARGARLREGAVVTRGGKVLSRIDFDALPLTAESPGIAIHRERLLACLGEANRCPVQLDARIVGFEQDERGVTAHLADGSRAIGSALVGCDGLRSEVRRAMRGDEPLRYAGYTTWRGVARSAQANLVGSQEIWGEGERFGLVPIGDGEIYWFGVAEAPAGGRDGARPIAELLERFAGWPEPVTSVVAATDPADVIRTDVFDRPPIDRWTEGRVTLLGDAAHPMTPNLGQGAGQAIEDAFALADAVSRRPGDLPAALRAYEDCRRDRANGFVLQSQRMGAMAQWKNPVARALRDAALRLTPGSVLRKSVEQMYTPRVR